jgi:hypothetical protein
MTEAVDYDEFLTDDGALLLDKLLRTLHRNKDGHLATDQQAHRAAIEENHNAAVLYIYTVDDAEQYTLNTHYVYGGHEPNSYESWREIVNAEVDDLNDNAAEGWHGVYGWTTTVIRITPLRNGDLFIAIDDNGARGVRLAFNTRKNKHAPRKS